MYTADTVDWAIELEIDIDETRTKGHRGSITDPPEPNNVEVTIRAVWYVTKAGERLAVHLPDAVLDEITSGLEEDRIEPAGEE